MPEQLQGRALELRDVTRAFIDQRLRPLADRAAGTVRDEVIEASKAAGLYRLTQPREFGGEAADDLCLTVVREELAAANLAATRWVLGPGPGVLAGAQGELRKRYLEAVMEGRAQGAFAFTEPADAAPTRAEPDGDAFIVNGAKSYVTGGDSADFVSTLVRIDDAPAFLVIDTASPGVLRSEPFHSLDGSHHVSITFDNVRVPRANLVGQPGEGLPRALRQVGNVRLAMSAEACGLARWALDFIEAHLRAPHRSGPPLGDREGVRLRFADLRIAAYAMRSTLYRTARLAAAGENVVNETIASKVLCTETIGTIADVGIQLLGGNALIESHPMARLYRRVRAMRLAEGASDVLRLNLARGRLELDKGRL